MYNLDIWLFNLINHLPHNPALDLLAIFVHLITLTVIIFCLTTVYVYFFLPKKEGTIAILSLIIFLITWLASSLIFKPIMHRTRPAYAIADAILVGQIPDSNSFPSGQAATAIAYVIPFFLLSSQTKLKKYLVVLALLTGLDRIYMGHHYPSDVIGGYVLGTILAYIGVLLYKHKKPKLTLLPWMRK